MPQANRPLAWYASSASTRRQTAYTFGPCRWTSSANAASTRREIERVVQFGVGPRTGQAAPELVDDPRDRDHSHLSLLTAARRVTLYAGETGGGGGGNSNILPESRRWQQGLITAADAGFR